MKKLSVLFVALVALVSIVSCNKDDDNDSSTSASIEGKWQITQEGESLTTLTPAEDEGSCGLDIVEFFQGGVYKVDGFDFEQAVCTPYTDGGTWTKKDNSITIKDIDGETTVFEILELTKSTLKIKSTDQEGTWIEVYTKK